MEIPNNTPDVTTEPVASEESVKEESFLSSDQYQEIQNQRRSHFKKHVLRISVYSLYAFSFFYGVAAFTWLWHLIMPEIIHYMPAQNYNKLENLLFGTIVGGLVSQFASKVFSD